MGRPIVKRFLWFATVAVTCSISIIAYQTMLERSDGQLLSRALDEFEQQLIANDFPSEASLDDCKFIAPNNETDVYKIIGCIKHFRSSKLYFAIAYGSFGEIIYMQGDISK